MYYSKTIPKHNSNREKILSGLDKPPTLKPILDAISEELRDLPDWHFWRWHRSRTSHKWNKVPLRPSQPWKWMEEGDKGVAWSRIKSLWTVYSDDSEIDGIRVPLGRSLCVFDFDSAIQDGIPDPQVINLVSELDTWTEYSASGTGLHSLVRLDAQELCSVLGLKHTDSLPRSVRLQDGVRVEFLWKTPICITGRLLDDPSDVQSDPETLTRLFATLFEPELAKARKKDDNWQRACETTSRVTELGIPDSEILERARNSANSAKFKALYDRGDLRDHDHDHSKADLGLMGMLAFWVGNDPDRLLRLFSGSALYRSEKKQSYWRATISKALGSLSQTYDWAKEREPSLWEEQWEAFKTQKEEEMNAENGQSQEKTEDLSKEEIETLRDDPMFSYLWQGHHGDLTDQDRSRRIKSQRDVFRLVPETGFFPAFLRAHLPRTDAPVIFHLASALGTASVLLGRRCAFWEGDDPILPNLWILGVAKSSDLRKSTVANEFERIVSRDPDYGRTLAGPKGTLEAYMTRWGWLLTDKDLIKKSNMDMADQGTVFCRHESGEISTVEALQTIGRDKLARFRQRVQEFQINGGHETKGICAIYTDELSSLLETLSNANAGGMLSDLLSAYDGNLPWEKATRHNGLYLVPDPYCVILSATTIEPIQPLLSSKDTRSGFLARFIFFRAEERDFLLTFRDAMSPEWKEKLATEIDLLRNCHGIVRYSPEAMSYFKSWRKDFEERIPKQLSSWKARYGTLTHKIALIYHASVSRGILAKEISLEITKLATAFIEEAITHVQPILDQLPEDEPGRDSLKIIQALKENGKELGRHALYRITRISNDRMVRALTLLEQQERILVEESKNGRPGAPKTIIRLIEA